MAGLAAVVSVAGIWALGSIANLAVVQDFAAVGRATPAGVVVVSVRFSGETPEAGRELDRFIEEMIR